MLRHNPKHAKSTLYVVATPIGNLQDFSPRAVEVLKSVDWIACEDTRHSSKLMQHFTIATPLLALHDHNERAKAAGFVQRLAQGESGALISDAGTPLISDPGYFLVRQVREAGLAVIPIPGPSAVITALSASGLATDKFSFRGFFPRKTKDRQAELAALSQAMETFVYYESPQRIPALLDDLQAALTPERPMALARELTKTFETWYWGPLEKVMAAYQADAMAHKGEYVVIIEGVRSTRPGVLGQDVHAILQDLAQVLPPKKAAKLVVKWFGGKSRDYYEYILKTKE